ncbi:b(0,+)-type amino acid transporter 1-like [Babylonia areolata]|uniref:b(0,+)-type amino acid transporter 1-like n=1 Tax=Babylonia areolata TaxID=304850 RepID=UPI003FCFC025
MSAVPEKRRDVEEENTSGVSLLRSLGPVGATSMLVGSMIGAGIFVSPKGVVAGTGSVALSVIVWILSGVISLLGALSYAELGMLMGRSGGEYQCLREAFGNTVAFLFAWTSVMVIQPASQAINALTFAEYAATVLMSTCGTPRVLVKLIAAVAIVTVTGVNCYSSSLAARVQIVFTTAKLAALGIIILGGLLRVAQGHTKILETGFEGSIEDPAAVSLAFYSALWAYDGWCSLNYVVEEIQQPEKNLLRSNVVGVVVVTTAYALSILSYYTVLSNDHILSASAVAVTWGDKVLGYAALLMPVSVMITTFGAANGAAFVGVRVLIAAGRHGNMPEVLSYVHCLNYTPIPSLVFSMTLSLLMIIPGDIGSLIDLFSFTAWLFYGLTFTSLLVFRYRTKWRHVARVYKVPVVVPVVMAAVSLYLLVAPIVDSPRIEFLYALLFMLGGLVFYVPFVLLKVPVRYYGVWSRVD